MEDGTRKKRHGRRRWGTVIKRKDDEGQVIAYVARYVSPLDKNKKIGKQFKPEYEAQAYEWLDEEHYLVILHNKGIKQWTPPNERDKRKTDSLMTFEEWTRAYFNRYKEKNGQMRGRTMRRTKLAVNRLMPYFRTMPLNEITENEVARWRRKAKKEIPSPDGYEKASFMLKRLMNAAVKEGLKVENPCKYSLTRSKPKKRGHPATGQERNKRARGRVPGIHKTGRVAVGSGGRIENRRGLWPATPGSGSRKRTALCPPQRR